MRLEFGEPALPFPPKPGVGPRDPDPALARPGQPSPLGPHPQPSGLQHSHAQTAIENNTPRRRPWGLAHGTSSPALVRDGALPVASLFKAGSGLRPSRELPALSRGQMTRRTAVVLRIWGARAGHKLDPGAVTTWA